jgi:exodeoxyribonuclease VII small subunit
LQGEETRDAGRSRRRPSEASSPASPGDGPTAAPARNHSTFEEAFAAAERAVDLLERGDLPLEDALLCYEEGLLAIKRCREILEGAQRRIEVMGRDIGCVVEGGEGPVWKPAASFPQLREALDALERGGGPPHASSPGGAAGGSGPGGR